MSEESSIYKFFEEVPDYRKEDKIYYKLSDMITLTVTGVISGAETWKEIVFFGEAKLDWLKNYGEFKNGIPPHQTLGRIMGMMDPEAFQSCFIQWMQTFEAGTNGKVVAMDGKTLRHSYKSSDNQKAIHMVSAFCVENRQVLGQVKTNSKSNEITAIPELIDLLDIRGKLVTIDAMGCQIDIAKKIIENEGDYLLQVKGNQPNLKKAFEKELSVKKIIEQEENLDFYQTVSSAHGRIEERKYFFFEPVGDLKSMYGHWEGIQKVGIALRLRKKKNEEASEFTVSYYISSANLSAEEFGNAARGHWCIESDLHWCLDVAMREDDCKIHANNAAENMSTVRRVAFNLLKREKSVEAGIKAKQKLAGYDNSYLARVLEGSEAVGV